MGIDLGFHLRASICPVSSGARGVGTPGGALVVGVVDLMDGLLVGDIITAVEMSDGVMIPVDATMRCHVPSIWRRDSVDLRTILDTFQDHGPEMTWNMVVHRTGSSVCLPVAVGPNTIAARKHVPDCQPVEYARFGGVVCQMRSMSHYTLEEDEDHARLGSLFRTPSQVVHSEPFITHVDADSPFLLHGVRGLNALLHKPLVAVYRARERIAIRTLRELADVLVDGCPVAIELADGTCMGATPEDIQSYEAGPQRPPRGLEALLLPSGGTVGRTGPP